MLLEANSKLLYIVIYKDGSVTREHIGCGFSAKQSEKTVHGDSDARTVTVLSLTLLVKAAALCGLQQLNFQWHKDNNNNNKSNLYDAIRH